MLSLQSFLREGRVVRPCWEKLKPKGPKGEVFAYVGRNQNLKDLKDPPPKHPQDLSPKSKTNNQDLLTQPQILNNPGDDPTPRTLGNTATAAGLSENTTLSHALNPTKNHVLLNLKLHRKAFIKNTQLPTRA